MDILKMLKKISIYKKVAINAGYRKNIKLIL